jgi:hypothetical protein
VNEEANPYPEMSMRRIKEVLRLKHVQGLPERAVTGTLGISNGTVHGICAEPVLPG